MAKYDFEAIACAKNDRFCAKAQIVITFVAPTRKEGIVSNGIKFVLLLSAILIVMFSLAFAQAEPFQAEVLVQTARMRWGPGSAFAVQHYANLGHVLTVLEADAESDPPWTWYYARTPSGVQSWIRGDLIRRTDAAVPIATQPDSPTGTYPVIDNNLCNTSLFRPCQDGTDHALWDAGYWANDRYDHWERSGWNLDIVYHQNPCKTGRLCTTREEWDAGHQEAQALAATATPDVTQTPVVIQQTVEVGVREVWETLSVTGNGITLVGNTVEFYNPPHEMKAGGTEASIIGGFRFNSESVRVTCQYWHNADIGEDGDPVESRVFSVTRFGADDSGKVNCISDNIHENDVTARQWEITLNRSYSGTGRITNVSWSLTATILEDDETPVMATTLQTYLENVRTDVTERDPTEIGNPYGVEILNDDLINSACSGRKLTEGKSPREVTRHEYSCDDRDEDGVGSTLTFRFTHDRTRGFLKPTATPTPAP